MSLGEPYDIYLFLIDVLTTISSRFDQENYPNDIAYKRNDEPELYAKFVENDPETVEKYHDDCCEKSDRATDEKNYTKKSRVVYFHLFLQFKT